MKDKFDLQKASIRRDLLQSVGDLLEALADDHEASELASATLSVQRITAQLRGTPHVCGLPGLSAIIEDE
jgi:hypothetical protein